MAFVIPLGLEPRTPWLKVKCSSQLSYEIGFWRNVLASKTPFFLKRCKYTSRSTDLPRKWFLFFQKMFISFGGEVYFGGAAASIALINNSKSKKLLITWVAPKFSKISWSGVWLKLIRWSRQKVVVAAEVMVMPRSCYWTMWSMTAPPSWTSPIL